MERLNFRLRYLTLSLLILFFFPSLEAHESWTQFVMNLRQEALGEGIRPETFDSAFQNIRAPNPKVLHFDKTQPERRISFLQYRSTRADPFRIRLGRREVQRYTPLLNQIERDFKVNSCFIVSLWGLETSYGHYMGSFPVIQSLATLAFDNRRAAYFHKQLLLALHILNDGHVDLAHFKGEWAGASGHPQFMPSSWQEYAVDYDQTGKKDIWTNVNDGLASIANYLMKNGWRYDEPWAIPVNLPSNFDENLINLKIAKPVSEWVQMGVQPIESDLPSGNLSASIIYPDGGPAMMVFNNFKVIMKWNHSNYYAGTVGYMAEQICQRKL